MFVFNKEQKENLDKKMFLNAELSTSPRHRGFGFFPRAREASQRPLGDTPRTSKLRASELRQLKKEVQTMVYRDTQDAALYSEKHPFSLKRRRHLNFF